MKPIVKWAGGKSRLLAELLRRVPLEMRTYAEPFAGGAALFFAIAAGRIDGGARFRRAVLADANEELVACYRAVRDDVDEVIAALGGYRYDRDLFYATRDRDTRGMSDVERAARLLFLNRTCFNGLWRVNAAGKFNVPFGRYKNPKIVDAAKLRDAARALRGVEIVHGDFAQVTRALRAGDFAYLDPPYVPLSRTAQFTSYARDGFSRDDQERLARELRAMKRRRVRAMLSNHDTPEARALYDGLPMVRVQAPRSISCDAQRRGDAAELIVTTWNEPGLVEERARKTA